MKQYQLWLSNASVSFDVCYTLGYVAVPCASCRVFLTQRYDTKRGMSAEADRRALLTVYI